MQRTHFKVVLAYELCSRTCCRPCMAGNKIEAASIWARTCLMRSVAQQRVNSLALASRACVQVRRGMLSVFVPTVITILWDGTVFPLRSKLCMLSEPALGTRRSLFALEPISGQW